MLGKYGPTMTAEELKALRMPFGKYKNRRIVDIQFDKRYLYWFIDNVTGFVNEDIIKRAISYYLAPLSRAATGQVRVRNLR
jgi:hypothetical protein